LSFERGFGRVLSKRGKGSDEIGQVAKRGEDSGSRGLAKPDVRNRCQGESAIYVKMTKYEIGQRYPFETTVKQQLGGGCETALK
jgi:hypothetical protein